MGYVFIFVIAALEKEFVLKDYRFFVLIGFSFGFFLVLSCR